MLRPALLLLGLIGVLAIGGASGGVLGETATPAPSPSHFPSPSPEPSATPSPTATPDPATPAPTPLPYTGQLHVGDWVQVTGTGDCLNVRLGPGLTVEGSAPPAPMPVYNCLPDGFIGRLGGYAGDTSEMPVSREGYWWWHLQGQGWVAADWLSFHHAGGYPWPDRPDLADAGLIAYQHPIDGSLWVMNADGSAPRRIAERRDPNEYLNEPYWSPDGGRLLFVASAYSANGVYTPSLRIVDTAGAAAGEYAAISRGFWSPDGSRLAVYRMDNEDPSAAFMVPAVLDLASGAMIDIGPRNFYYGPMTWSPDGARVALVCTSAVFNSSTPDGQPTEVRLDCGGDGLRTVRADGSDVRVVLPYDPANASYSSPRWSPDGRFIALASHTDAAGCRGMVVLDALSGSVQRCIPFSAPGGGGSQTCGGGIDGSIEWSPDARFLAFNTDFSEGKNGVFVYDFVTGGTTHLPAGSAWKVSMSGDGRNLAYGAEGFIWSAGIDGGNITLLGEGLSPVWQPLR